MEAGTLNCPMCGAPQAPDATKCDHCGARLATVACPSCFGLIFEGAKFCSHCGAKVAQPEVAANSTCKCPHCHLVMSAVTVGASSLLECGRCEGLWVDNDTFQQICADREKQSAVLGMPGPVPVAESGVIEEVHYFPCPVCSKLMNRINFAHCSHVIVDVCTQHGTWFDKDELRKIIEFIRAGGLDKAREREISNLEQQRALGKFDHGPASAGGSPIMDFPTTPTPHRYDGYELAFDAIGAALGFFLKR